MHAALVTSYDAAPRLVDVPTPQPEPGHTLVHVDAVGVHHVVRARANGSHYSCTGALPLVPGVDGVGHTDAGTAVWFSTMASETRGSLAQQVMVPEGHLIELPDGLDPVATAAAVNPLIAAWMSLFVRGELAEGQHLVVIGATGAAGRATLSLAQGVAGRVTAVGRDRAALDRLVVEGLASDALNLTDASDAWAGALSTADVIVDFLWGQAAACAWDALAGASHGRRRTVRHVQVGTLAGSSAPLPGSILRGIDLRVLGSAPGAYSFADMMQELPRLLERMSSDHLGVDHEVFGFAQLEQGWAHDGRSRTVFDLRA